MNTLRILRDCLPEGADPNTVTLESTFDSLGMDSLDFIFYIGEVEVALGIQEIPVAALKEFRTLGDLERWLALAEVSS